MKYRFLKHTADAKFRAYGKSLEEAFINAAKATASLMWEWSRIENTREHAVEVRGRDHAQVLVAFLEEMLFLFEARAFLLHDVEDLILLREKEGYKLTARFVGDTRHETSEVFGDVKAITYSEMEIRTRGRIHVQVVVDL